MHGNSNSIYMEFYYVSIDKDACMNTVAICKDWNEAFKERISAFTNLYT